MAKEGRRAREALAVDTTPGKILALAILANAPIALGFILAPILARDGAAASRAFVPLVLVVTPLLAVASLVYFFRASDHRKRHRASRIGVLLDATALLLWAIVLVLSTSGGGPAGAAA